MTVLSCTVQEMFLSECMVCLLFCLICSGSKDNKHLDVDAVGTVNGVSVHEFDLDSVDDKPWRKPGRTLLMLKPSPMQALSYCRKILYQMAMHIAFLHCALLKFLLVLLYCGKRQAIIGPFTSG